jgi:hypothetical protein
MSTVVEQGTIRNIIRGIDQKPLEASLFLTMQRKVAASVNISIAIQMRP